MLILRHLTSTNQLQKTCCNTRLMLHHHTIFHLPTFLNYYNLTLQHLHPHLPSTKKNQYSSTKLTTQHLHLHPYICNPLSFNNKTINLHNTNPLNSIPSNYLYFHTHHLPTQHISTTFLLPNNVQTLKRTERVNLFPKTTPNISNVIHLNLVSVLNIPFTI